MRSKAIILRAFVAALGLLAAASAADAVAADPPASITSLATKTSLTTEDRSRIDDFAQGWGRMLGAATTPTEEVRRVRNKLLEPVRSPGITPLFRDQYSRSLVPELQTIISGSDAHRAVNALIVTSGLGSERALDLLVDHTSIRDEPARFRRLAAARGCSVLFARSSLDDINANRLLGAARRLQEAAREEPDAVTLRHQLQAMVVAAKVVPNEAGQDNIRSFFIRALDGVADTVANPATPRPVDRLAAAYPVLNELRGYFLELDGGPQRSFGRALGPVLQKMLDGTDTRWDEIHSRPRPDNQPANFIELAERFLSTIDAIIRGGGTKPPSTQLRAAWQAKNRDQYRAGLRAWQDVVSSY